MKHLFKPLCVALLIGSTLCAKEHTQQPPFGTVNFQECITDSKYGKREQEQIETVKTQMDSLVKDLETKLTKLKEKLDDPDYLDTLSPEAEGQLKAEFEMAQQEMGRYQSQYYQVMQQTQMRLSQVMAGHVAAASEKVAEAKKLSHVVHKDVCFYSNPSHDVTRDIIASMDLAFAEEEKARADEQQEAK